MFDKSPEVAPLLVKLYDSHRICALAKDDAPLAKLELTGAVADLLEVELSAKESELLSDVLIGLMRQAETDLREALSERLAALPNVPLRLALHIANDEISVAAPVLRRSPVLSDLDLLYIIKAQGSDYWQAIADRGDLSPQLVDALAGTKDQATAAILSANDRAKLTQHAVEILSEMARHSDAIARPLLMRPEIPESVARKLYAFVGQELKEYIRGYYGLAHEVESELEFAESPMAAVEDVVLEFSTPKTGGSPYMPTEAMIMAADKFASFGTLTPQLMIQTLERGQIANFVAMFARFCGLPPKSVHDALRQPQPKSIAIACRAFNVMKQDFARMYLLTQTMRSKDRTVRHAELLALLSYFESIRPEMARKIVRKKPV
jgi:uncharacterized protein (DUF2336 family)